MQKEGCYVIMSLILLVSIHTERVWRRMSFKSNLSIKILFYRFLN